MKIKPRLKEELKQFIRQKQKEEREIAVITSSYPLQDQEITTLRQNIPELKTKKITNKIDREILAGAVIQVGSRVLDLSLKNRIALLQELAYETDR